MKTSIIARRHDDIVIRVGQDNKRGRVIVLGINDAAEKILMTNEVSLKRQPLQNIVDPESADAINEYLEYGDATHDLSVVLGKIRHFKLMQKSGNCVPVKVRAFRIACTDNPKFELLIRDISIAEKLMEYRHKITNVYESVLIIHSQLGMPDEQSTMNELRITGQFCIDNNIDGVVAFGSIVNIEDQNLKYNMMRQMHELFKEKTRIEDFMGYFGNDKFMMILTGCPPQSAINALSRIHNTLCESLNHESDVLRDHSNLAIGYTNIAASKSIEEIIQKLEKALGDAENSMNSFIRSY